MARIAWDRLLETCYRRGAEVAVLVPGSPPLIRLERVFRPLQAPRLAAQDVAKMAQELIPTSAAPSADGYSYVDFWYGNFAYFRCMAFGFPDTTLIVLSQLDPSHPPPPDPPLRDPPSRPSTSQN